MAQGQQICRAVRSLAVKLQVDIYHMHIAEGNIIPLLDYVWDEVAYIQIGYNPGRREPGTGEINYRNVFRHTHGKGYTGIVGMARQLAARPRGSAPITGPGRSLARSAPAGHCRDSDAKDGCCVRETVLDPGGFPSEDPRGSPS